MSNLVLLTIAIVLCVAGVAGIYVAANKALKRADMRRAKRADREAKRRAENWSELVSGYNPETGYEESFSGSEAYDAACEALSITDKIVEGIGGQPMISMRIDSANDIESIDASAYIRSEMDMQDRRDLYDMVVRMRDVRTEAVPLIDKACVLAHSVSDPIERRTCFDIIGKAAALLEPSVVLRITYPDEMRNCDKYFDKYMGIADLAATCGVTYDRSPLDYSVIGRISDMRTDGYRCVLCGQSAMVGASLRCIYDPIERCKVTLCDKCSRNKY